MTCYADILWAVNFGMDMLIMFFTSKILKKTIPFSRIAAGSALSALAAVLSIIFLPEKPLKFLSLLSVIPALTVSFRPKNFTNFAKQLFFTCLSTFLLGGFMFSFMFLGGSFISFNESRLYGIKPLFFYAFLILCVMFFGRKLLHSYITDRELCCEVTVHFMGKTAEGRGFMDTGNFLKDPVTGKGVIAASFSAVEKLFPSNSTENLTSTEGLEKLFSSPELITKLRLIPYSAFGEKQKFLMGFLSDYTEIALSNGQKKTLTNSVIGVTTENFNLSTGSGFIINPEILK